MSVYAFQSSIQILKVEERKLKYYIKKVIFRYFKARVEWLYSYSIMVGVYPPTVVKTKNPVQALRT